jgi:hypothetical protein
MTFLWGLLARSTEDSTTIDEAITDAIDVHNEDPDAHNLADQALEVHRVATVIDHLAESVVNDKLSVTARSYVAIVDPDDDESFDSIAGAITYAQGKGGGNILIVAGTHYITSDITLSRDINLYGADRDTTTIVTNDSTGGVFLLPNETADGTKLQEFKNIEFQSDNGPTFRQSASSLIYEAKMVFNYCKFSGNGEYFNAIVRNIYIDDCIIECDTSYAFIVETLLNIVNSTINAVNSSGTTHLFDAKGDGGIDLYVTMNNTSCFSYSSTACAWLGDGVIAIGDIYSNFFTDLIATVFESELFRFMNNFVELNSSGYMTLDVTNSIVTGNRYIGGSGNRVRLASGSVKCIVANNVVGTAITNSGTGNIVVDNVVT